MRRIILLSSLLFLWTNPAVFSQTTQNEHRLIRLHYTDSSGEKGLTTFEYDHNGLMYKALWKLLNGERCSVNYYSYDENSKLVKKYREFSDGIISIQLYKYSNKGNLTEETFWRSDSVTGKVIYSYDHEGKRLKAKCKGMNGWFYGTIDYEYNNSGNKKSAKLSNAEGDIGSISYSYDSNNKLTEEVWNFNSGFSQTFIYEYQPDKNSESPYTGSKVFLNSDKNFRHAKEYYD